MVKRILFLLFLLLSSFFKMGCCGSKESDETQPLLSSAEPAKPKPAIAHLGPSTDGSKVRGAEVPKKGSPAAEPEVSQGRRKESQPAERPFTQYEVMMRAKGLRVLSIFGISSSSSSSIPACSTVRLRPDV